MIKKRQVWLNIELLVLLSMTLSACSHTIETLISQSASSSQTSAYNGGMYTELNAAVKEGNLDGVQRLIQQRESPNLAADYRSGADTIAVGNLSFTILCRWYNDDPLAFNNAIGTGDIILVRLMLDYGADATSGLQTAIAKDQTHIIQTLIQYGADPNAGVHLAKSILNEDALILLEEYRAYRRGYPW